MLLKRLSAFLVFRNIPYFLGQFLAAALANMPFTDRLPAGVAWVMDIRQIIYGDTSLLDEFHDLADGNLCRIADLLDGAAPVFPKILCNNLVHFVDILHTCGADIMDVVLGVELAATAAIAYIQCHSTGPPFPGKAFYRPSLP